MSDRKRWTPADVIDVAGPSALLRTYLEQGEVRLYLQIARTRGPITRAYDVGCGFGRLTPVLTECAAEVSAFERERAMLDVARPLQPSVRFIAVDALDALPVENASAAFVMTFTVLQHLADDRAERTLREIARVLEPRGHLLLVEETDPSLEAGDPRQAELGYTRGRPVDWYAARAAPLALECTSPRTIEPGYARPDVGTYMFFRKP